MRHHNPTLERLAAIPLFAACTSSELKLIATKMMELDIKAGEVLIREGGIGREFLVIETGTAMVVVGDQAIARLGPGDFAGEIALLDHRPRTATVVADSDLVIRVCSAIEFAELVTGAPNLARSLLAGLATRLRANAGGSPGPTPPANASTSGDPERHVPSAA